MIEIINGDFREWLFNIIRNNADRQIIIVSDPPFNIGYHYNNYKDDLSEEEYYELMFQAFSLRPSVIIHYPEELYKIAFQIGKFPEKVVSWVYNSNTQKQHRDIAFFGVKPDFNKVRQPYKNPNDKRVKALIARGKTGSKLYDWWNVNQVKNVSKEKTAHPCQMPVEVMKNIIGILPDDDKPQTRTITLSLCEEQYTIATACIDYVIENDLIAHDYGNNNKKSNALFEAVYEWAEQKNLN